MKLKILFIGIIVILISGCHISETIKVFCPWCKVHVYNYKKEFLVKGQRLNPGAFTPASLFSRKISSEIKCPKCDNYLNGWEYWGKIQGYKSFTMAYPAVSLLTKENNKWRWMPEDMPMLDFNREIE